MSIVDSHLKLIVGAKDLHLQHNDKTSATFPGFYGQVIDKMSDLKRFSLDKGEEVQLSLLWSPLLANAAVPDNYLFSTLVEARVEVKGQIRPIGGHVHRDPDTQPQEPLVRCSLTHSHRAKDQHGC